MSLNSSMENTGGSQQVNQMKCECFSPASGLGLSKTRSLFYQPLLVEKFSMDVLKLIETFSDT